jgi:hypothetical protein
MPRKKRHVQTNEEKEERHGAKANRRERGKELTPLTGETLPPEQAAKPKAALEDPRLTHPANASRRIALTQALQRQRGNAYVRRAVQRVRASQSSGHPLKGATRENMEETLGEDFSAVRVHTGPSVDHLAHLLRARAFTSDNDIFVRSDEPPLASPSGKRLLTHELTHVVQQRDQTTTGPDAQIVPTQSRLETEARQSALLATRGQQVTVTGQAPAGAIQCLPDDGPVGTLETSEGVEEIEGEVVTAPSSGSINERLATQEGNINVQIQSWVEDGVGDLRDGIQDAANSFNIWYGGRPRKPNTASFAMEVAKGALSVISAVYPPASIAVAIVSGLLSVAGSPITQALDPNAEPDAQARQIQQNMIRLSVQMDGAFANFGPRLKRENSDLWNDIGIAITMDPPVLGIAQSELFTRAGVPRPNQPYGERILARMIYTYTDWERQLELRRSTFFISAESVEYAMFTEGVRRRLRTGAEAEARRRLGTPETER